MSGLRTVRRSPTTPVLPAPSPSPWHPATPSYPAPPVPPAPLLCTPLSLPIQQGFAQGVWVRVNPVLLSLGVPRDRDLISLRDESDIGVLN